MKEPYIKGIAIHDDPESCASARKDTGEALTGVCMGTVLSREIRQIGVLTPLRNAESNTLNIVIARCSTTLRGRRPVARTEPSCTRTGRSHVRSHEMAVWAAAERPEVVIQ